MLLETGQIFDKIFDLNNFSLAVFIKISPVFLCICACLAIFMTLNKYYNNFFILHEKILLKWGLVHFQNCRLCEFFSISSQVYNNLQPGSKLDKGPMSHGGDLFQIYFYFPLQ